MYRQYIYIYVNVYTYIIYLYVDTLSDFDTKSWTPRSPSRLRTIIIIFGISLQAFITAQMKLDSWLVFEMIFFTLQGPILG